MTEQAAEIERLKAERLKTLTAQSAILEWVKITHRLDSPAEGIRALIQSGKRLVPALVLLLGLQVAFGQNPPVLRNSWSTNSAGTPVRGLNNLSVTNMGSGTNWLFYGIAPQTVARLVDITGASGLTNLFSLSLSNASSKPIVFGGLGTAAGMTNVTGQLYGLQAGASITLTPNGSNIVIASTASGTGITTNANQFGPSVQLTIKDGAFLTNLIVETSLKVSNGFFYASGPVTNNTQLNLPHLTVSRSAVINAQGDVTNSSADSNWSLYPTNVWNDRQFGSANLTNWSLIPTGAMANVDSTTFLTNWANAISNLAETKQLGSDNLTNWSLIPTGAMANAVSTTFLTNWANAISNLAETKQLGSVNLTNWSLIPTGAMANVVSTTFLTNWANAISNLAQTKQLGSANLTNWSLIPTGAMANVVSTDFLTNWANAISNLAQTKQLGSANLTNWSLIPTGAMANVVSTTFLTNWANAISNLANTKQFGTATLTNLSGTGAVTNLISLSLSNATVKPIVFGGVGTAAGMTNTTGQLYGLEAGSNITLTPNGSNIVVASTASGSVTFADLLWTNEPAGRIHPTTFTNRVETQRQINIGTNSQAGSDIFWGAPGNTNDLLIAWRSITNGEQWEPRFEAGVYSNTVSSSVSAYFEDLISGWSVDVIDGNGNLSEISLAAGTGGNLPWIVVSETNGFRPFATVGHDTTLNNVIYRFPPAQGSAGTVLTNDGAGILGWGTVAGTASGPAALTNLFTPSLSNATIKPIVFGGMGTAAGMTNVTGRIYGLEAGANMTLTPNGSNIVVAASGSGLSFSDLVWTNNGTQILPKSFPTNVLLRVNTPDDGIGTNYYWDAQTYRTNVASKLFAIYNGGSNALTVGGFGGIFIGRNNAMPGSAYVFQAQRDTVLGEPPDAWLGWSATHSGVGYSGSGLFGTTTNASTFGLTANDGNVKLSFLEVDTYFTNALLKLQYSDATSTRGMVLSPGFNGTPTNYLFNSAFRLTNIHTLFSLQNSNTRVFEVDGIGDLKLLKRIAYSWPGSQGASQTLLTNDGSGNLGWQSLLIFQPASDNLTNWSNIPTGAMANVVSTTYLTNWANAISNYANTKQFGTATLTNLSGTGAITNLISLSLSNASIKPIVFGGIGNAAGMTNTTGQLYGLEAGGNVVLTPNGSNITIQATLSGGGYATNANQFGAQVTLTLKDGIFLTNLIAFPSSSGVNPGLSVTNLVGIGTNSFQVLNTNGVPVIFAATNNGVTLVASNLAILGTQTNTSSLNVLGGVTNWAGVETRGNATNAGWLAIAGGFTNIGASLLTGSVTNGGRVDAAGGVTNWIGAETKGTLYASSNLTVKAGQSVSNVWVGGILFRSTSSTAFTNLNSTVTTFTNASQYIVPAHTLTNNNDTIITEWTGKCIAGTNNIRMIYGYQTVLDTGLFTNGVTSWRAGMTISRTAGVGGHADAWFAFSAIGPISVGNFASSGYYTNLELTCTNGVDVTNLIQLASRSNGGISNNTMVVRWEPASK